MARFRFVLRQQGVVQIFQQRHIFRGRILEILAVDHMNTAVNDRLFYRLQALFAAHHQLTQRKNKVSFQCQRIVLLAVIAVDVHRVDILRAGGTDVDNLSMQTLHQRSVLCFRVADDNIIVRHQKSVGDLTLCRETFARTGSAQNQAIGVFQLLAVHHDEVVGQGIQTVIQAFFARLVQFLRGKGDEDGSAAGGQPPLNFDLAIRQRQRGHQSLFLLEIQTAQVAVVLLSDGACLKDVVFQFLLRAPSVQNEERYQKHSLVLALQLFQKSLCISAVGRQIRRNDVDIISGTDGFLLLLDLAAIQFRDGALDRLDGLVLVNGLDVHGNNLG